MGADSSGAGGISSRWIVGRVGILPLLGLETSAVMLASTGFVPILLAFALVASGIIVALFSGRFTPDRQDQLSRPDFGL